MQSEGFVRAQYTRPPVWHDREVPPVLISGHHANIQKWQREQSLEETAKKRPDLLKNAMQQGKLDKKEMVRAQQLLEGIEER